MKLIKFIEREKENANMNNRAFMIEGEENYKKFLETAEEHTVDKTLERFVKHHKTKEDVCEWKGFDNSLDENKVDWVYETTCGKYIGENHTSSAFKFCPYCGKGIKLL